MFTRVTFKIKDSKDYKEENEKRYKNINQERARMELLISGKI